MIRVYFGKLCWGDFNKITNLLYLVESYSPKKKLLNNFFFNLKIFFYVNHFLSLHWICYDIASVLCSLFFGQKACGILSPQPRIEPTTPALEGKVPTTETPGKFQQIFTLEKN